MAAEVKVGIDKKAVKAMPRLRDRSCVFSGGTRRYFDFQDMNIFKLRSALFFGACLLAGTALAQPGLTIYNGGFSVIRDTVVLELKAGETNIRYSGATSLMEPSSVILRDPTGRTTLSILEQNYLNDPVSESSLLALYEGQVIGFRVEDPQKGDRVVEGKVIRAGNTSGAEPVQPIIEVEGKLSFELPGRPLFPALRDDNILKPLLSWKIQSPVSSKLDAELAYITQGLEWSADYNLVLESQGNVGELNCWVTIRNDSGKQFEDAQVKLIAGDVNRVSETAPARGMANRMMALAAEPVEARAFDDFHLYTLPRPITLRDRNVKQVEFARAPSVKTKRTYIYDASPSGYSGQLMINRQWASEGSTKIESRLEFANDEASKLGIAMPAGKVRVYRRDGEQLEFVGEDRVGHTPRNETVTLKLGNAFDLLGHRAQTEFNVDQAKRSMDESFELRLKNRGRTPVEIRVVEHLSRHSSWTVTRSSAQFRKKDSNTIEFDIPVAADSEITLTYGVRYTW